MRDDYKAKYINPFVLHQSAQIKWLEIFFSGSAVLSSAKHPYHRSRYCSWPFLTVCLKIFLATHPSLSSFFALDFSVVGTLSSLKGGISSLK